MLSFHSFLVMGTVMMFIILCFAARAYDNIPLWKVLITAVALLGIGVLGAYSMFRIESGRWGGRSFYGAVFLVPVLMYPVSKALRIRYGDMMDICAPAGCIMSALLKVKCYIDGCCYGRVFSTGSGDFQFPSQFVEGLAAIFIMVGLFYLIWKGKRRGTIYCWFMILYGIIRFILNLFRSTSPWIGILPAGNFWSLISIMIGSAVMFYTYKKKDKFGTERTIHGMKDDTPQ